MFERRRNTCMKSNNDFHFTMIKRDALRDLVPFVQFK